MNSLAPTAFRISWFRTRPASQAWHEVDSLAARLARGYIRPYSQSRLPVRHSKQGWLVRKAADQQWQRLNIYALPAGVRTFASHRIITTFEDLPSNYRIEDGLPFREKPLSQPEVVAIFGKVLDVKTANRLLRVVHGRRVAGTLEDPSLPRLFKKQAFDTGLEWLRKHVPVDEIACAGLRAELELAQMEDEQAVKAEKAGLYRPNSRSMKDVYGKSGLEAIREAKEKQADEKEALEKRRLSKNDGMAQKPGQLEKLGRSQVELRRPGENAKLKYYLEQATVWPDTPPEMSKFQRLWPSGLVVLAFVGGCILFASVHSTPKKEWRLWPDMPPSAATIIGIILANTAILVAWRIPPLFKVLNKYFITLPGYPFPVSLIGNIFSHQTVSHFSLNMVVLWFVGTRLHEEVGRGKFLAIYLCCGALGSYASLASWVLRNNFMSSSLGASGAISGILSAYLILNGSERVTFFGFPPENWPSISAMTLLVILIGLEFFAMNKGKNLVTVDHWAHLGGYFSGIGAAELLEMRTRRERETEMERRENLSVINKIREGRV